MKKAADAAAAYSWFRFILADKSTTSPLEAEDTYRAYFPRTPVELIEGYVHLFSHSMLIKIDIEGNVRLFQAGWPHSDKNQLK